MNNKKGFTLIELLAVIVILAVIALIAVPIVTKLIQSSKGYSTIDEETTGTMTTSDNNTGGIISNSTTTYNVGDIICVTLDGFTTTNDHTAEGCTEGQFLLRVANTSTPEECSTEGFSQTACGTVLEFVDVITTHAMNSTYTNVGGWPASEMRTYINDTIYNALPTDIKSKIIDTTVVSSHGYSDEANFTSTDKLYLLSGEEIYGTSHTYSLDTSIGTSRQLDYYNEEGVTTSNSSGAIKKLTPGTGDWWGLRSAYSYYSDSFLSVNTSGDCLDSIAASAVGVSPAFRIQ